ncbi:Glycosyltransferase [Heracleum sosnowskyi]|uniref:Glycosyltransferases n=1 Tax=Heracleum sosnowskyi TaxID=360622 RepID=A0AAD8M5B7_9APIA|nr:Glycosyltransferase [Heracleum sosnowskyi]
MKISAIQQSYLGRRSNSFRGSSPLESSDNPIKSPATIFWLVFHCLCCLVSLVLGFRFSRLVFFLLFTNSNTIYTTSPFRSATDVVADKTTLPILNSNPGFETPVNRSGLGTSSVVVGRHGILIRPWPHPNPDEVMKAHRIIERVQREQKFQYGIKNPRSLIVVTPTYVRTFQTLHFIGLMHSLMNVPFEVTWIVVEAGGPTNETSSLLFKSGLSNMHIGFDEKMPNSWEDRHKMEARMRIHGLRVVREKKLDGIVMFADDSNMHSMEFFDEIQKVKEIGAVSVGILAHSGHSDEEQVSVVQKSGEESKSSLPIQGPACNSSDQLVGWHTFDPLPYLAKSARYIGDKGIVLPMKMEWAGFVLASRLLWEETENNPDWVKHLQKVVDGEQETYNPLSLLKDPAVVEPLGSCGRKVMLWWLRVEARNDSKFPARWIIDPPLEVTVPAKRTPWPDAPPELLSNEKVAAIQKNAENTEKHATKTRTPRSKRSSRSKRKREARGSVDKHNSASQITEN